MTLIVGVRCSDGVVLGADGAVTMGGLSGETAQQRTVKKLSIVRDAVIVGMAGPVGLGQRLRALIEDEYVAERYTVTRPEDAMGPMRLAFWTKVVAAEWQIAAATAPVLGNRAMTSAAGAMLVALPLAGNAELLEFDQQCSPELKTAELPSVAIGSGQAIADPFLAFIRRIFWPNGYPSIADAIFSTVWTLRHAIDTVPGGGVADPIQIVVLEQQAGAWKARELSDAEREQHEEARRDAQRQLITWRSQMSSSPTGAAPEKPPA